MNFNGHISIGKAYLNCTAILLKTKLNYNLIALDVINYGKDRVQSTWTTKCSPRLG